jgi:hypothetical protein
MSSRIEKALKKARKDTENFVKKAAADVGSFVESSVKRLGEFVEREVVPSFHKAVDDARKSICENHCEKHVVSITEEASATASLLPTPTEEASVTPTLTPTDTTNVLLSSDGEVISGVELAGDAAQG